MFGPAFSDAVDELYAAALDAERWPDALHKSALAIGGVGTVMNPYSVRNPGHVLFSPRLEEAAREYAAGWWRFDRAGERGRGRTGVITDGDVLRPEEIARDPFYQEFRRRHGIGGFAQQFLPFSDGGVLSFAVQRAWDRSPFDADDLRTLAAIGRHAARAVLLAERLSAAPQEADLLQALDRIGRAALVVRADGRVLCLNDAAERVTREGLLMRGGRIRAASSRGQDALDRLVLAATRPGGGERDLRPVPIERSGGRKPLLVEAVPLREGAASRVAVLFGHSAALVLVTDPDARLAGDPKPGLLALGLTPGEARVAALVGTGSSPAEAAAELGLSTETVRSVLKKAFAKLDVSRQSELAALVARLAFSPHP